jgi:hypothetical protein
MKKAESRKCLSIVQKRAASLLSSFQLALLAVLSCLAPGCAIAYAIEISIERSSPTYPGEESCGTSAIQDLMRLELEIQGVRFKV